MTKIPDIFEQITYDLTHNLEYFQRYDTLPFKILKESSTLNLFYQLYFLFFIQN